jgi:hypothetical protein
MVFHRTPPSPLLGGEMPTKRSQAPEFYIARDDGYAIIDGVHYHFRHDVTTVDAGHPLLKSCPDAFRPFSPTYTKAQHNEWKRQQRPAEPAPEHDPEPATAA